MGIMAWIVPDLLSGMIGKRLAGRRRGSPGLIMAYCLSGSGTAHAPSAAGVGPTELGPLS